MATKDNVDLMTRIFFLVEKKDDSFFSFIEKNYEKFTMDDLQFIFNSLSMWTISDRPSLAENLKHFFTLMRSTELCKTDFRAHACVNTSLALIENSIEIEKLDKLKIL